MINPATQITIDDIKTSLTAILDGSYYDPPRPSQLAVRTANALDDEPAISIGEPEHGSRITSPGVECIISDATPIKLEPLLAGQRQWKFRFQISLELWQPLDVDPTDILTDATLLYLSGQNDSPLTRIVTSDEFYGRTTKPVTMPRINQRKARAMLYIMPDYRVFDAT